MMGMEETPKATLTPRKLYSHQPSIPRRYHPQEGAELLRWG